MAKAKIKKQTNIDNDGSSFDVNAATDLLGAELDKLLKKTIKGVEIESLDDVEYSRGFLSTGNYRFDWAISGSMIAGGIPISKISMIYGDPGSGKSLLKYVFGSQIIRMGGLVYDVETEDAANKDFVKKIANDGFGHVVKRMRQVEGIETIEDLRTFLVNMADLKIAKKDDTPIFVSVDSLSQLSSIKEMEDASENKNVRDMTKQQAMRSVFRTISRKLRVANITLFLIAHTSAKIGGFGNPVTKAAHGAGAGFAASLELWLTSNREITASGKHKVPIGAKMKFKVMKNRAVYKGRTAEVNFLFNGSIQKYSGLLELLNEYGVLALSSKEINAKTKMFYNADGEFIKKKIKEKEIEAYELEGFTIINEKEAAEGEEAPQDGKKKKGSIYAVKGEEVPVVKLKEWLQSKGGEEVIIKQWEDKLNAIFENIDPKKDDVAFFEEDENTFEDVSTETLEELNEVT